MTGRPTVTLKLATSLDGRIATSSGESQWITGEAARHQGHRLRACHDAILVGIGTVLADDPALTVRLPGHTGRQPLRVVLDSRLRTPETAQVAAGNSLIFTTASARPIGTAKIVEVVEVEGRPNLHAVLDTLYARGIRSVLIEGGGEVVVPLPDQGPLISGRPSFQSFLDARREDGTLISASVPAMTTSVPVIGDEEQVSSEHGVDA